MLKSKRFLTLTLLFIVAAVVAGYALLRLNAPDEETTELRQRLSEQASRIEAYTSLLAVDSIFNRGDYQAALRQYEALQPPDSLLALRGAVTSRIQHARRLLEIRSVLDSLEIRASRGVLTVSRPLAGVGSSPVRSMPLAESRPAQYDSLLFALQKADMQIRNLQGQLRRSSGGNYLTFESRQGNAVYYVGDVRDGKANGRGVALLSSGSRYLGEWKDNQKHGVGEFHWPDGAYYEGEYEEDERSGEGTYHFPGGEIFIGEWDNDLREGDGIFYDADGEVVAQGEWDDDELVEQR
ncbi:hypothetical protein CLV84_0680 [Neolewinella xylanilytica]|uniref:MORN repeat protein n=1 Tax=Neolewinella xylanilytica TaxID=1514080 RepID=A0A2S6I8B1_9BACT|nr:hypothetical protein [Neolewinella xylanilytica]PPK87730.1 hypothetical protein CLV84_0680 [Neolewinella xylanilytica]